MQSYLSAIAFIFKANLVFTFKFKEKNLLKIGAEVLGDLSTQHETLARARDRMRSADTDLNRSQLVLSTMIRRLFCVFLFGTIKLREEG